MIGRALRVGLIAGALLAASDASAQHEHDAPPTGSDRWTWSGAAQVFLTANLQERRFTDFRQIESPNWLMGTTGRRTGRGALWLSGMLSLEPFTLRDLGSAQVFQTGETFGGAPLIDYQHPHDLWMQIAATYRHDVGSDARLRVSAALAGEPALGPTVFMHRGSALSNPSVPLTHHELDSTHIASGVFTAALERTAWSLEASAFRGREPDEDRLDLDLGAIDSWSARVVGRRGGWLGQISGARLRNPHAIEPGDVTRLTASIEYAGAVSGRERAMTLAWGVPRAPPGFEHPHELSLVGAWTTGYEHRLAAGRGGRLAAGGDLTLYYTPRNLYESYGHPVSMHVFLRWSAGVLARRITSAP